MNTVPSNKWITFARSTPNARLRLFCLPYAGGGASIYRSWADGLPESIDVFPIQLPGRENRMAELSYSNVHTLVKDMAEGLMPCFDIPFAFWGHSMGAMIGFELARYLRRMGLPTPVHLFVSARYAPELPHIETPVKNLSDAEFFQKLKDFQGTPEAILQNAEIMQLYLPILRADFTMHEDYIYRPEMPLAHPISAFGGLMDETSNRERMLTWREQTSDIFTLHMFPGDHFFIAQNNLRQLIFRAILQDLSPYLRN